MWNKIKNWLGRVWCEIKMNDEERWLAQSADLAELERRLQSLRSNNYTSSFHL